ncbi:MAG TPA: hypothetical protein PKM88_16300, partial [bacterium]|nr:hypothetical protein [bacterium]
MIVKYRDTKKLLIIIAIMMVSVFSFGEQADAALWLSDTTPYYQPFTVGIGNQPPPTDWRCVMREDTTIGAYSSQPYSNSTLVTGDNMSTSAANDTINFYAGSNSNNTERAYGWIGGSSCH